MVKKGITIFGVALALSALIFISKFTDKVSSETSELEAHQPVNGNDASKQNDKSKTQSLNSLKLNSPLEKLENVEEILTDSKIENSDSISKVSELEDFSAVGNGSEWELLFNSIENTESHFINEKGHILNSGIESFFKANNFTDVLTALDKVGTSQESVGRMNSLKDSFYEKYSSDTHSEAFSCANKICAVTFVGDPLGLERYQDLSLFSDNYIFTNQTENEFGESVYKMLLIETDDPSKLTVDSN